MRLLIAALLLCFIGAIPAKADPWCGNVRPECSYMLGATPGHPAPKGSASLSGVVSPLASKASEIVQSCGSRIISTVRHTRVRGSGRPSLHNYGRAVDITGNPNCIYARLADWPGGYSIDYGRIRPHHVHISFEPNGREWGAKFQHYHGSRRIRLAHVR